MSFRSGNALAPLVSRLSAIGLISSNDIRLILALPYTLRAMHAGWEILREGDSPTQSCLILEGTCCRFKMAANGARQIASYHIRGDIPDLQGCYLGRFDHNLSALTAGTVAFIPHHALKSMMASNPDLAIKFWRETLIDNSISREWLCNIGRRSAGARIAHLICELFTRHQATGSADKFSFPFPLTQTAIGDAQGLSNVHVNRVMQKLKADGLILATGKTLTILNWAALKEFGDFDAGYLHLRQ